MELGMFKIDLGQGDYADVSVTPDITLEEFIDQLKSSNDEWVHYGDTAFQKIHIKRVTKLS